MINRQTTQRPGQSRSLGAGRSPKVQRRYEQMMAEDMGPWTEFLKSNAMPLQEVWYNVHVGQAVAVQAGSPEYMKAHADAVSRKRIDVIGRTKTELWIIEVKPYANMQAIGQVLVYEFLYSREFAKSLPTAAVIIATTCDGDIIEAAAKFGIRIITLDVNEFSWKE
ncbi:hypothetical protein ES705_10967 [subsurface metagenome]